MKDHPDRLEETATGNDLAGKAQKARGPAWSVWRQDDNGHVFLVRSGMTEADARRLARDLERKGHKQAYWVKEEP